MSKYSFQFKLELVRDYLSGKTVGYKTIGKKYGVKAGSQVENWIKNYEKYGEEGLRRKSTKSMTLWSIVPLIYHCLLVYQLLWCFGFPN